MSLAQRLHPPRISICLALALQFSATAGDTHYWIAPGGGDWNSPDNWSPPEIPADTDTAIFNLDATYEVYFSTQSNFQRLEINGGNITFQLGSTSLFNLTKSVTYDNFAKHIAVAGPHSPSLKLVGGSILTGDQDSTVCDTEPEVFVIVGSLDGSTGHLAIEDMTPNSVAAIDLCTAAYLYCYPGSSMTLESGDFGWHSNNKVSGKGSVTYDFATGSQIVIQGTLSGSAIFGGGDVAIFGTLDGMEDDISFGTATIEPGATGTFPYTEDLYPGRLVAKIPLAIDPMFIWDGSITTHGHGNSFGGRWTASTFNEFDIILQNEPSVPWACRATYAQGVFASPISVRLAPATQEPAAGTSRLLIDGYPSYGFEDVSLADVMSGTVDIGPNADHEVIVTSEFPLMIWLRSAPLDWCSADQNFDGIVNFFDIAAFVDNYNEGLPWAQLNNDAVLNFFDVAEYIDQYLAGCP